MKLSVVTAVIKIFVLNSKKCMLKIFLQLLFKNYLWKEQNIISDFSCFKFAWTMGTYFQKFVFIF